MSERATPVAQWFLATAAALGLTLGAVAGLALGGPAAVPLGAALGVLGGLLLGGIVILASRMGDNGTDHHHAPS